MRNELFFLIMREKFVSAFLENRSVFTYYVFVTLITNTCVRNILQTAVNQVIISLQVCVKQHRF
jgi:hypothetical protein